MDGGFLYPLLAKKGDTMVLGLTGGIASGKSLVAACFAELGAIVVSADVLAREIVNPGSPVLDALVKAFGPEVLTEQGGLNREALGRRVFADSSARGLLEKITHPAIAHLAECRLAELRNATHDLIVYEAPLLFEAGAEARVDQVLVVVVDPQVQMERLCLRDRLSSTEAQQRVSAQWPQADKVKRADFVIDNSGSLQQTRASVEALFNYLVCSDRPEVSIS